MRLDRQRAAAAAGTVLGHRPFRRQLQTQVLHAAGDVMVAIALANTVFFAVPLGEARSQVALYLALTMAPFAVLSPLIGPWLDRRAGSYRVAVVGSMILRVVFAVLLSSRFDQLYLYPLAFGLLVMSRIHGVSRSALVPDTLPPNRSLMWANSWVAIASVAGGAAGAGPALGINAWLGTDATLWSAAVVFAAGALTATGLPSGEGAKARRERVSRREVMAALSYRVLAGGVAMATLRAAVGYVTFLLAFLLKQDGAQALGLLAAAAGVGSMAGSVLAPLLRRALRESLLLLTSILLVAAIALWAAGRFGVLPATLIALTIGLAAQAGRLAFDSLLQSDAPDRVRARAFARYETIFQLCWVAAAGLATVTPFGPAGGLWTLTGLCLAGIALAVWTLRRGVVRNGVTAQPAAAPGPEAAATSPDGGRTRTPAADPRPTEPFGHPTDPLPETPPAPRPRGDRTR